MRRRKSKIMHSATKLRDLQSLDERVAEIDDLTVEVQRHPRALRQAAKEDNTKPRKGRSR